MPDAQPTTDLEAPGAADAPGPDLDEELVDVGLADEGVALDEEAGDPGPVRRLLATWVGTWRARVRVVVTVLITVGVVAALSLALGAFGAPAILLGIVVGLVVSATPPEVRR